MKRKIILYVLVSFYFLIALGDVSYNVIKTYPETKEWYFLSDTQKRHLLFGEFYDSLIFIDKHTSPKSSIFIVSKDDRAFFFGRYYLYPKYIQAFSSEKAMKHQQTFPLYISSFDVPIHLQNYALVGTVFLKETKKTTYLYKKS